eukprot:359127_1
MDAKHILVFGYIRTIEKNITIASHIPTSICELVFLFYPKHVRLLGIGKNLFGQFGLGSIGATEQFTYLQRMSSICDFAWGIYSGYGWFVIKDSSNHIYRAGCSMNDIQVFPMVSFNCVRFIVCFVLFSPYRALYFAIS